MYVRDRDTVKIYSYDATTDSWSQLPDCVTKSGSLTVINGQLTSVGGVNSNELLSLTGECAFMTSNIHDGVLRMTLYCIAGNLLVQILEIFLRIKFTGHVCACEALSHTPFNTFNVEC